MAADLVKLGVQIALSLCFVTLAQALLPTPPEWKGPVKGGDVDWMGDEHKYVMPPSLGGTTEEILSVGSYGNSTRRQLQVKGERGAGWWSVKGSNYYDQNGNKVWFGGVQWSGMEVTGAPHGLWSRNYKDMLKQIKNLGFNQIRFAFAGDALKPGSYPHNINYGLNPDLQGLNSLQVMDKVIEACGPLKIKIILDYHRMRLTWTPEWGLWWDVGYPESTWLSHWEMLAIRYKDNPTVMGFDLFNEVHNWTTAEPGRSHIDTPIWAAKGKNDSVNWRTASIKAIQLIQKHNKNVIIFVEGMWWNAWWAGNLKDLRVVPITRKDVLVPNKVALSAHDYGPNVWDQPWYKVKNFPDNMPGYWGKRWGFIVERGVAPVWLGEFGCFMNPPNSDINARELKWVWKIRSYIRSLQLSWTWFNWGPDSMDTGGILKDDWISVREDKVNMLKYIMHPNFGPSPGQTENSPKPKPKPRKPRS